jgi:signal transduction histidine kinase
MRRRALICAVVVFSFLFAGACWAGDKEVAVSLVDKAIASFQDKGKDYTLRLLNTIDGPFRKGPIYVFATSLQGVTLSHPANRNLRGKNVLRLKDARGKEFIKEFIAVAKDPGSGWVEYWWKRHGEKRATLKRSFIKRVPGEDFLVGAGFYIK